MKGSLYSKVGKGLNVMKNEVRNVYMDADLEIEAYQFKGLMQKFPAHFHDYYVIGFIEEGQRLLICQGEETIINPGDLLLFNPFEIHSCAQIDGKTLDYRCLNIKNEIMEKVILEINGRADLPTFTQNVLFQSELVASLKVLHEKISNREDPLEKEELFYYFLEELILTYSDLSIPPLPPSTSDQIEASCIFLRENYSKKLSLDIVSDISGWSKYHFLRTFTKEMGISPNSYLMTIRIHQAKEFLEQGDKLIDVALATGFTDQSHFTKFFKSLIGLTPKQYMRIVNGTKDQNEEMSDVNGNFTSF